MPKQTQKQAARERQAEQDTSETPKKDTEALKADLDALLDEVDGVLDGNEEFKDAQAFVDGYQQKGGQ